MPMNKVVHAAQRAAFSAAIDSAIKAVRGKGPENISSVEKVVFLSAGRELIFSISRPGFSVLWPSAFS